MEWHYASKGKKNGPVPAGYIRELIATGKLVSSDLVWRDGLPNWIPAAEAFSDFPIGQSEGHPAQKNEKGNYFRRHWRGELSLGVSYWANGFLGNILLLAAIYSLAGLASRSSHDYSFVGYWAGVYGIALSVVIWQLVGIWRSADNHVVKTGRKFWAGAAKVAVALGFLRFVGDFMGTGVPAIRESIEQGNWLSKNAKWEINLLRDGSEIEVRGGVGRGITADIERFLTAAPNVKLVHLNLEVGGLVEEGQKLNALLRQRNLAAYTSSQCVSACTIAFMGGVERYLKKGAKLGFHAYKVPGLNTTETDYKESKQSLIASGVSREFVEKVFNTSNESMWYPETEELLRSGVVTAMVSGDEFGLSGFQRQALISNIESVLLANRLYKAIQQREPDLYATIITKFKDGLQAGKSMDELRPTVTPYIQILRVKYLPYASDESVKAFAEYFAQVAKAVRPSPKVCLGYFRDGEPQASNAAIKMYSQGLGAKELELLAGIIQSADFSRRVPSKAEKERLLAVVIENAMKLLGERAGILAELSNPQPDPASWCDSFYALYLTIGSMPANQARVATLALLE